MNHTIQLPDRENLLFDATNLGHIRVVNKATRYKAKARHSKVKTKAKACVARP